MKKTFCYLTVIAAFALAFVSCQKEEISANGPVFNGSGDAIAHPEGKTVFHPDNNTFTWKNSDRLHIWDASGHHKLYKPTQRDVTASPIAPAGTYNTLDATSHYRAIYPDFYADTTSGTPTNVLVTLPVTQCMTNQEDDVNTIHLTRFPMYCETDNHTLYFKNLCGAIRLHLELANTSVERVAFSSTSDPVCGQFSIDWNDGDPVMTTTSSTTSGLSNATNTVVLEYAQPIDITSGADFWISLPPATYDNFQIKVSCLNSNGTRSIRYFKNQSAHPLTIPRGVFIPMNPTLDNAYTVNSGLFSVSPTQQVYFSPGNLQCVNNHWEFSPKQYEISYDIVGSGSSAHYNYDPNTSFKWYLFGWSTTDSEFGRALPGTSYPSSSSDASLDYVNYGEVFSGRGVTSSWRVLSADEWGYLVGHSSCSTTRISAGKMNITVNDADDNSSVTYTNFGARMIKVGDQFGLLLFPDVCTINMPAGVEFPNTNGPGANQTSDDNYYTKEQFISIFENAGCAFLPSSGYKEGPQGGNLPVPCSDLDGTTYANSPTGYYWTSSYSGNNNSNKCQALYFTGNSSTVYLQNDQPRNSLYCVRLVTNYTPASPSK